MILFFLILNILIVPAFSSGDLCDFMDIPNCRGITKQLRRNTFQSAPSASSATSLNPANLRFDKGLGLEVTAQQSNPVSFGLTSGTGKMGGALLSGSMDNTFFGNRIPEHDENFLDRHRNDHQFKNRKLTGAFGVRLFNRKNLGLDLGTILKRHNAIKKLNIGGGLGARIWIFHLGASMYRDDYDLDMNQIQSSTGLPYSVILNRDTYHEGFILNTYTVGFRIMNFSFDLASMSSKFDTYKNLEVPETKILIYAASFNYDEFLLNAAIRKENSAAKFFDESSDSLRVKEEKTAAFYSLQYAFSKNVIFGVSYNYFLLKEFSASVSLFI